METNIPEVGTLLICRSIGSAREGSLTVDKTYEVYLSGSGDHPFNGGKMPYNLFAIKGDDGMAIVLDFLESSIGFFDLIEQSS